MLQEIRLARQVSLCDKDQISLQRSVPTSAFGVNYSKVLIYIHYNLPDFIYCELDELLS